MTIEKLYITIAINIINFSGKDRVRILNVLNVHEYRK